MLATVEAGSLEGVDAHGVHVEVNVGRGLPGFEIVGLAEPAVRESRVRVRTALEANGYELPPRCLVLNLAPADVRKTGSGLDLAIAVGVLVACGSCAPDRVDSTFFMGELGLSGEIRPVRGALPQLLAARRRGIKTAVVPQGNAAEARLVVGIDVRLASHLCSVVAHLDGVRELPAAADSSPPEEHDTGVRSADLADVRGQACARRALEVAAVGTHTLLFVGPPGSGKTMLARRLPALLPEPTDDEALEIAAIASAAGALGRNGYSPLARSRPARPFRAPHHSVSSVALLGGGNPIRPGELTLAHRGVLFLDELPEFHRDALEALRTALDLGEVSVIRAHGQVRMPARSLLVAAMNPCPCGYAGDRKRVCGCSPNRVARYTGRVSGPLLDRFDMHVVVPRLPNVRKASEGESSETVRARVTVARAFGRERGATEGSLRAEFEARLRELEPGATRLADDAVERLGLSARGYLKALRVARTLADMAARLAIAEEDVAEALQYRALDRNAGTETGG